MKKSRRILLGTVLSVSLTLTGCDSTETSENEEEHFTVGNQTGVIYNRLGIPHVIMAGNVVQPMPADHPQFGSAVKEGQSLSSGHASSGSHVVVTRAGFGSSAGLHVSS